jgi:radical SAM superfamily enzyme YgiQ (UPF0313 family)
MGILYIGAELERAGFDVEVIDGDIDGLTIEELIDSVVASKPDLVGFSIMTPQGPATLNVCLALKQRCPDLPIVLGGAHIASTITDIFSQADCFDFVINGEGEITMVEVCENMQKGTLPECLEGIPGVIYKDALGMVQINPPRAFFKELDEFAPLDYSMVDVHKYTIPTLPGPPVVGLMITRGCPFKCTYCDAPITTGKKIRFHSPERAVSDIVRLHNQFGVRGFSFRDSTFTAKKRWVREFCELLIESGVDVAWRCNTRVDCVTEELLTLMKRAGCHTINFGVESGHPVIMKRIHKDVPLEMIEEAHRWTNKLGIRTYTTFLVGAPGETDETMRATVELAKRIRPSMAMFFVAIGYPGTEMYTDALQNGLLEPNWWHSQEWDPDRNSAFEKRWGWSADAGALNNPGFDAEAWQKRATREFYLRPRFVWDTIVFTLKNPYFLRHVVALGIEILPVHKLIPWKRGSVNKKQRQYSRCPQAATVEYERRTGTDAR